MRKIRLFDRPTYTLADTRLKTPQSTVGIKWLNVSLFFFFLFSFLFFFYQSLAILTFYARGVF